MLFMDGPDRAKKGIGRRVRVRRDVGGGEGDIHIGRPP